MGGFRRAGSGVSSATPRYPTLYVATPVPRAGLTEVVVTGTLTEPNCDRRKPGGERRYIASRGFDQQRVSLVAPRARIRLSEAGTKLLCAARRGDYRVPIPCTQPEWMCSWRLAMDLVRDARSLVPNRKAGLVGTDCDRIQGAGFRETGAKDFGAIMEKVDTPVRQRSPNIGCCRGHACRHPHSSLWPKRGMMTWNSSNRVAAIKGMNIRALTWLVVTLELLASTPSIAQTSGAPGIPDARIVEDRPGRAGVGCRAVRHRE
jgi:hypothetical protein